MYENACNIKKADLNKIIKYFLKILTEQNKISGYKNIR